METILVMHASVINFLGKKKIWIGKSALCEEERGDSLHLVFADHRDRAIVLEPSSESVP